MWPWDLFLLAVMWIAVALFLVTSVIEWMLSEVHAWSIYWLCVFALNGETSKEENDEAESIVRIHH